ncbi:MAG: hypothetical protein J1E80_09670 [Desulfovibrionaceae bacterium]|nr:hypothetical protein [Desulfovibrionaceae bacterium]
MILDDNLVFLDGAALTETAASGPVALNALFRPGTSHGHIPLVIMVSEEATGGDSLELKLEEADSADGGFSEVATLSVPAAELKPGARVGWRHLPHAVTKGWIRLTVTPSGSFSSGKIFAALTREDAQPYSHGMYKNAGRAAG